MTDKLTWSMTKAGAKVRVSYRYENGSDHTVYAHTALLQQLGADQWKELPVYRVEPTAADRARLTIGLPPPAGVAPPRGVYTKVEPGASVEGAREVDVPLLVPTNGKWQPMPALEHVTLALEIIDGEPTDWIELPTANGKVRVPDGPTTRTVVGDEKPLP
jgi:hypothetical protein